MQKIKIGKLKVVIYDNIADTPIVRYQKFVKYSLIDAGIGSTIAEFDMKISRARKLINRKEVKDAMLELDNLRQLVHFMQNEVNPKSLAFAALVFSINGEEITDISESGLQETQKRFIDAMPVGVLHSSVDGIKKKIGDELTKYFPKRFEDSENKEYFDIMKARTMAVLNYIENGEGWQEVERLTDDLILFTKPRRFSDGSVEIENDKGFESMNLILSKHLNVNPKTMSVLEYYNAFEFMEANKPKAK